MSVSVAGANELGLDSLQVLCVYFASFKFCSNDFLALDIPITITITLLEPLNTYDEEETMLLLKQTTLEICWELTTVSSQADGKRTVVIFGSPVLFNVISLHRLRKLAQKGVYTVCHVENTVFLYAFCLRYGFVQRREIYALKAILFGWVQDAGCNGCRCGNEMK